MLRGYGCRRDLWVEVLLGMDPTVLRDRNMVREGMVMPAYYGETANACALDRCMEHCKKMFNWDEKYPVRDMGNGKVRAAGVGMAMQGSCISNLDVGSATLKLNEDGGYNLLIGAADMGTGCDTILAQMAAECMDCSVDDIAVFGADTDASPYDSGSYASSTTYITGKAVEKACADLKKKICEIAAQMMNCEKEDVAFESSRVRCISTGQTVSLSEIAYKTQLASNSNAEATASHFSPVSPPPYMVGMAEIELDKLTGEVKVLDFMAVVDCGIPINPALARIQAEGGIVQGIGHTLMENVTYDKSGRPIESTFMQYKIPTRLDMGKLKVEFEHSYEPTGPFGAKSIGEIVINTPAPAIAHAIYRATGVWHRELPITPEEYRYVDCGIGAIGTGTVAPYLSHNGSWRNVTMRNISLLIKPVSGICNMTCDYCFYCDEAKKRTQHVYGMMNEKTLETIIEKTIREADAVASFTWQGGEPTLRGIDFFEKAVALQKKYKQQYQRNNLHIMNSFQTNGYELDRQWAKFFKRNQFLVGLSIDGLPEIHDLLRKGKMDQKAFLE